MSENKPDYKFIILNLIAILLSLILTCFAHPLIQNNEQAINIIVTVYSVLAGFLIAIIAVIGDPLLIPPGSWRIAEGNRKKTLQRLNRHKYLFYIYVLSLGAIFTSVLFKNSHPNCKMWLEKIYMFLSIYAFLCSLCLPSALMQMQQERVDNIIESRKNTPKEQQETTKQN